MSTTHTWLSRTDVGLPRIVYNNDGVTPRRPLRPLNGLVVVHYTGMALDFAAGARAWVPKIESAAKRLGKSNEYNYVIDEYGTIADYAGVFQGAHCRGHNDAYGVLFLNAIGDPLTDAQVDSFRFWLSTLKAFGFIAPGAWVLPHRTLAATACPGDRIMARFTELDRPHQ
jgi:hypothetical protein